MEETDRPAKRRCLGTDGAQSLTDDEMVELMDISDSQPTDSEDLQSDGLEGDQNGSEAEFSSSDSDGELALRETLVTPFVAEMILGGDNWFHRDPDILDLATGNRVSTRGMVFSKAREPFQTTKVHLDRQKQHRAVVFGSSFRIDHKGRPHFGEALVNGDKLKIGDCVAFIQKDEEGDKDENHEASALTTLYGRITTIFKDAHNTKYAHLHLFQHSRAGFLRELGGARELFLTSMCCKVPLQDIVSSINVECRPDSGPVEKEYIDRDDYFYRYYFENANSTDDHGTYTTASLWEDAIPVLLGQCQACLHNERNQAHSQARIIGEIIDDHYVTAFEYKGITYRVKDFAYFNLTTHPALLEVCQILSIRVPGDSVGDVFVDRLKLKLLYLGRFDESQQHADVDFQRGMAVNPRDERHLFLTRLNPRAGLEALNGRCQVRHHDDIADLDVYKDQEDSFYVKYGLISYGFGLQQSFLVRPADVKCSEESQKEYDAGLQVVARYKENGRTYTALGLFDGFGGLSMGLDYGGAIKTQYAIDYERCATDHLLANRQTEALVVYNEDVNACLERAIRTEAGHEVFDLDLAGEVANDMPPKGKIDFIHGGFPCHGITRGNRQPRPDDIRNTLVLSVLSYVEFYQPEQVLLENVLSLMTHQLAAVQNGQHSVSGGIPGGILIVLVRALTGLGYQVQYTVLQAERFGLPQKRSRVFISAARIGNKLPQMPQNTHGASQQQYAFHQTRSKAPFLDARLWDVLTDLPAFDWINPHLRIPQTVAQRKDRAARAAKGIEQMGIHKFSGRDFNKYPSAPLSELQRTLRRGLTRSDLTNHVTQGWPDVDTRKLTKTGSESNCLTERVCNVPLQAGASLADVPEVLRKSSQPQQFDNRFLRLDGDGMARTLRTSVNPSADGMKVLHPTQHRVLSTKELSRLQGFPDSYRLLLPYFSMDALVKGLGNAVPVHLGHAWGKEYLKMKLEEFQKLEAPEAGSGGGGRAAGKEVEAGARDGEGIQRSKGSGPPRVSEVDDEPWSF